MDDKKESSMAVSRAPHARARTRMTDKRRSPMSMIHAPHIEVQTKINERERFLATMNHKQTDRFPYHEWWFWNETLERWYNEGLPRDADLREYFGFDRSWGYKKRELVAVNLEMVPPFPQEILRNEGETYVVRDERGIVKRLYHNRTGAPQWLEFPVTNRQDLHRIHRRFDATDPTRYPENWNELVRQYRARDYPLCLHAGGFFGYGRYLMGDEQLLCAFAIEPDLIREMFEFRTDFILQCIDRALDEVEIDYAWYWEDMAYRSGSLISPEMFRRFMVPQYQRINEHLHAKGVDKFFSTVMATSINSSHFGWNQVSIPSLHLKYRRGWTLSR